MDASLWPALTNTLSTLQFFRHGGFVYKVVMERNGYGWFWYSSKFATSHSAGKIVFGCINVAGYDVRTVRIVCVNAFGERQQCCNIFLKNRCCGVVFFCGATSIMYFEFWLTCFVTTILKQHNQCTKRTEAMFGRFSGSHWRPISCALPHPNT